MAWQDGFSLVDAYEPFFRGRSIVEIAFQYIFYQKSASKSDMILQASRVEDFQIFMSKLAWRWSGELHLLKMSLRDKASKIQKKSWEIDTDDDEFQ